MERKGDISSTRILSLSLSLSPSPKFILQISCKPLPPPVSGRLLFPPQHPVYREYVGQWDEGYPSGEGRFFWTDGSTYTGEWRLGARHGKGDYLPINYPSYRGQWLNNLRYLCSICFSLNAELCIRFLPRCFRLGFVARCILIQLQFFLC